MQYGVSETNCCCQSEEYNGNNCLKLNVQACYFERRSPVLRIRAWNVQALILIVISLAEKKLSAHSICIFPIVIQFEMIL